ncbi:MAG: RNA polymerase sigma factor [Ignavibacteria bacterium]|nr:RNA polymerase sigma factor [Ignavibacteria bacterium]
MEKDQLFNEVLSQNKDRIYRICCAYERDPDERNDLYQEIMINIWKSLDKFEGRSLISTWIYRIAVNTSLLHVKRSARKKQMHTADDVETLNIPETDSTEEKIRTGTEIEKLFECINRLKEVDRLIISMVLDDLSYKEIAEVTGMTTSNVGVKINRIKKELAKMMGS